MRDKGMVGVPKTNTSARLQGGLSRCGQGYSIVALGMPVNGETAHPWGTELCTFKGNRAGWTWNRGPAFAVFDIEPRSAGPAGAPRQIKVKLLTRMVRLIFTAIQSQLGLKT